MDQRGVLKIGTAIEIVDAISRRHLENQQKTHNILSGVSDLLDDNSGPAQRSDGLALENGTPEVPMSAARAFLGENNTPNIMGISPIFLKSGFFGSSKKFSWDDQSLVGSGGKLSQARFGFKQRQVLEDGVALSPLDLETTQLPDSPGQNEEHYYETNLAPPLHCREPVRQNEEQELEYESYRETWRDEDAYRAGYLNAEGEVELAEGYTGSIFVPLSLEEFEARFPDPLSAKSQLEQKSHADIVHTEAANAKPSTRPEDLEEGPIIPHYNTRGRTAFPRAPEYEIGDQIRHFRVFSNAGQGTFSRTYACDYEGPETGMPKRVCVKMVTAQGEESLQQAICEIQLLTKLRAANSERIVRVLNYFYLNNNLFIVEDLHHDNLYEVMESFRGSSKQYFHENNLRLVARQMLEALEVVHSHGIIHCDIKPENILLKQPTHWKSAPDCVLIDFGSARYTQEHNSEFYLQSRPYRSPEVILGCGFDAKVDLWSLGCVLAELFTSHLLFDNASVPVLLSQFIGLCGPVPEWMLEQGSQAGAYFREGRLFEVVQQQDGAMAEAEGADASEYRVRIHFPKPTTFADRLAPSEDVLFVDFIRHLVQLDPRERPSASEALKHEWFSAQ